MRKTVYKNTYIGGDCTKGNSKNCLFDDAQVSDVKCDGVMIKIPASATNKDLACKWKCVDSKYDNKNECSDFAPEKTICKKKSTF